VLSDNNSIDKNFYFLVPAISIIASGCPPEVDSAHPCPSGQAGFFF